MAARYHVDPFARTLDTEVLRCEPLASGARVELADTIFHPTGGGQPHDVGEIGGTPVRDVRKESGTIWHVLDAEVDPGPVHCVLDWPRRFDHMQQHSGQHLISAIALARFGWSTVGFHLGAETSTVDLRGGCSAEALPPLEAAVNEAIRAAHPISDRFTTSEALAAEGVRTRGLPDGFEGEVRVVEIDGIDTNACGGTHLRNTAQMQAVAFVGTEKVREDLRLHFLVGGRVLSRLHQMRARAGALTDLLRAGPPEHAALIQQMQVRQKEQARSRRQLEARLAEALVAEALHGGDAIVEVHHPEPEMSFLQAVARGLEQGGFGGLALLTGGEREGVFILLGSAEAIEGARAAVLETLEAKGGGKGRLQGKAKRLDRRAAVLNLLRG